VADDVVHLPRDPQPLLDHAPRGQLLGRLLAQPLGEGMVRGEAGHREEQEHDRDLVQGRPVHEQGDGGQQDGGDDGGGQPGARLRAAGGQPPQREVRGPDDGAAVLVEREEAADGGHDDRERDQRRPARERQRQPGDRREDVRGPREGLPVERERRSRDQEHGRDQPGEERDRPMSRSAADSIGRL
jgi:hypothetical protein